MKKILVVIFILFGLKSYCEDTLKVCKTQDGRIAKTQDGRIVCQQPIFTPTAIGGMVLFLEADDYTATTSPANLYDKSPQGHVFSQSTGSQRALVVANALNGHNVLRFNAANNTTYTGGNILNQGTSSRTTYIITKYNASTQGIIAKSPGVSQGMYIYYDGGQIGIYSSCYFNDDVLHAYGSYEVLGILSNVSTLKTYLYINNTLQRTNNISVGCNQTSTATFEIGAVRGSYSMTGDIALILMYDRALSVAERTSLDAWIFAKYGLHIYIL